MEIKFKKKNRITFKIKTGCYLELFTPGTMILLGSTKIKLMVKWWKWKWKD